MDGDSQTINTDFLQDLDMWLLQGGSAPPAMTRHSLDVNAANAAIPSLDAALLTPTAPIPSSDKTQADNSFVAALTDDMMPWTALSAVPPLENDLVTLPLAVPTPPPSQEPVKPTRKKPARTRKGRPPASAKATELSTLEPPQKKGKPNKSTSQRQKEELAYLREKSQELEVQLTSLRQKNREELERQQREEEQKQSENDGEMSTAIVTRSLDDFGAPLLPEVSLWERIAKRQREEKAKAEVENVKLREMVQSQMRLVKSFERLLRKRKIWDQLQEKNASAGEESRKEEEVLEEMVQDVDSRYPHVDKVLNENGLGEADPAVNVGDDANMKYSPTEGMYLEYKEKKYMPFNYKTLDDVVWRSFGEGKLKLEDSQLTILKSTDEMLYSRTVLPLSKKASNAIEIKEVVNSVGLSVIKRFTEDNLLKYVWFSKTSVKRPGDNGDSPVLLVQKGCAVLEPATLPDGSPGCAIRSYTSSVPTLAGQPSGDDQEAQHREVEVLTEMVFAAYQQSRQSINQTLENLVLDEMMAKNAASTPTTSITDTDVSV